MSPALLQYPALFCAEEREADRGSLSRPPPGPAPRPATDAAGCVVKQAALAYSQKALSPPRHADRIAAALDLTGCPGLPAAPLPPAAPPAAAAAFSQVIGAI